MGDWYICFARWLTILHFLRSRRHGTTLFTTLLAGWAALLSRLSGRTDMLIGVPAAKRVRQEVENPIGFFVTVAVHMDVSGSPPAAGPIGRAKVQMPAAQQNQTFRSNGSSNS